jgi:hypothetical protein
MGINGMPYIAFSSDVNTTDGLAQVYFTKQVMGPSLFAPAKVRITGSGYINNYAGYYSMRVDGTGGGVRGYVYFLDMDHNVLFTTASIMTLDVRGDTALMTGTGVFNDGRRSVDVAFVIKVVGNQNPPSGDYLYISLSNGYKASGYVNQGSITTVSGTK